MRNGPREAERPMHIQQGVLDESLRSLGSSDLQGLDVRDAIARVVDATRTIFEVEGAGLMLVDPESVLRYVVSTDPGAAALEQAQEDTGTGPCVESLVLDCVVRTVDVTIDERWPEIHDRLTEAGVRAVLGLPIAVAHTTVGSLNVYRPEPYEWDDSDENALHTYAALIEDVMTSGLLAEQRSELVEQLEGALDRRVTIDRAVGVVMGTEGLGPLDAFARLRRVARSRRIRAAELAQEVLENGRLE
jgi:GAF domain-containing protein